MEYIFWLAIILESAVLGYFVRKGWRLWKSNPHYIYPQQYRQALYPILVFSAILIVSLFFKYYFQSDKSATLVALLPLIVFVLALLGMIVATIMVGGRWH
jgi:hypothetical protein